MTERYPDEEEDINQMPTWEDQNDYLRQGDKEYDERKEREDGNRN